MKDIWARFMESLEYEDQDMIKALSDLIRYLGFDDFEKSTVLSSSNLLSTEVLGFDDRRIFVSVFEEKDYSIKGRYIITDKKGHILDYIIFKKDNNKWVEVE